MPFPLGRNCLCSQTKVINLFRFRVCLSLLGEDVVLSVSNITSVTLHYISKNVTSVCAQGVANRRVDMHSQYNERCILLC